MNKGEAAEVIVKRNSLNGFTRLNINNFSQKNKNFDDQWYINSKLIENVTIKRLCDTSATILNGTTLTGKIDISPALANIYSCGRGIDYWARIKKILKNHKIIWSYKKDHEDILVDILKNHVNNGGLTPSTKIINVCYNALIGKIIPKGTTAESASILACHEPDCIKYFDLSDPNTVQNIKNDLIKIIKIDQPSSTRYGLYIDPNTKLLKVSFQLRLKEGKDYKFNNGLSIEQLINKKQYNLLKK